ncbi:nitroreductase family protein [Olsenella profusa]|uniref:Nitroreductase family protein n=1 Tax=Olsenella profusa TaxID=138595 RepID=A0ABS2F011_9ACTN|nr:nitroreductase family protein [Olsenella profusa]MBM6774309.1 nitroreductase family protein [Olsenella profusa]
MTDFLQLAQSRYSCRAFTDQPVEPSKVDVLLEAAVAAPTAVDRQPWHAWVVQSPEAAERLAACTRFSFGAKTFVVVGARPEEAWVRKYDNRNFADVDASIVATHVMLAAHDLGLGTTWVGHFDAPALAEAFPEMAGYDLIAIFPLGYPAPGPEGGPSARHTERRAQDELVTRL